jgi:hypothetical protein
MNGKDRKKQNSSLIRDSLERMGIQKYRYISIFKHLCNVYITTLVNSLNLVTANVETKRLAAQARCRLWKNPRRLRPFQLSGRLLVTCALRSVCSITMPQVCKNPLLHPMMSALG